LRLSKRACRAAGQVYRCGGELAIDMAGHACAILRTPAKKSRCRISF
jgi:hypothetical protein